MLKIIALSIIHAKARLNPEAKLLLSESYLLFFTNFLLLKHGSRPWVRTLDMDSEKSGSVLKPESRA